MFLIILVFVFALLHKKVKSKTRPVCLSGLKVAVVVL